MEGHAETILINSTKPLSPEEKWRLQHEALHAKHKGHEAMHLEMVFVLFVTLAVAQLVIFKWKQYHQHSYQLFTLLGMWLIPVYFNIRLAWWRMMAVWSVFSVCTLLVIRRAAAQPLSPTTPRFVYKWFYNIHRITYFLGIAGYFIIMFTFLGMNLLFLIPPDIAMGAGITVIFYGLYYGVLGRDCAEICTEKIAIKMGFYSDTGLPSKRLMPNICSVCGQELTLSAMEDVETNPEKTFKLTCGHLFHEFCIRGWCIIGKKQTCPYCKEKVDLKRMFKNPWERPHVLFGQLLDWIRYLVVWFPIILMLVRFINYMLGLE